MKTVRINLIDIIDQVFKFGRRSTQRRKESINRISVFIPRGQGPLQRRIHLFYICHRCIQNNGNIIIARMGYDIGPARCLIEIEYIDSIVRRCLFFDDIKQSFIRTVLLLQFSIPFFKFIASKLQKYEKNDSIPVLFCTPDAPKCDAAVPQNIFQGHFLTLFSPSCHSPYLLTISMYDRTFMTYLMSFHFIIDCTMIPAREQFSGHGRCLALEKKP